MLKLCGQLYGSCIDFPLERTNVCNYTSCPLQYGRQYKIKMNVFIKSYWQNVSYCRLKFTPQRFHHAFETVTVLNACMHVYRCLHWQDGFCKTTVVNRRAVFSYQLSSGVQARTLPTHQRQMHQVWHQNLLKHSRTLVDVCECICDVIIPYECCPLLHPIH